MTSSGSVVVNSGEPGRMDGVKKMDTILRLEEIKQKPLREFLATFDDDRNGKIDISELQLLAEYHRWWKWSAKLLFMLIMIIIASIFGLTNVAILLTKDMGVKNGHLAAQGSVVKMSIAQLQIPLAYASLLDTRRLDALEHIKLVNRLDRGAFAAGTYKMRIASYVHANETFVRFYGEDGGEVEVRSGAVWVSHPKVTYPFRVCGSGGATCSTLAVDVDNAGYLEELRQRAAAVFPSPDASARRRLLTGSDKCKTNFSKKWGVGMFDKNVPYCCGKKSEGHPLVDQDFAWMIQNVQPTCEYATHADLTLYLQNVCGAAALAGLTNPLGDAYNQRDCANAAMHLVSPKLNAAAGESADDSAWWAEAMGSVDLWKASGVAGAMAVVAEGLTSIPPSLVYQLAQGNMDASFDDELMKWRDHASWVQADHILKWGNTENYPRLFVPHEAPASQVYSAFAGACT